MAKIAVPPTPNQALVEWAKMNKINPAQLARKTGFSYAYAWSLLSGDRSVTPETFGRLALAFGSENLLDVEAALKAARPDGQAGRTVNNGKQA